MRTLAATAAAVISIAVLPAQRVIRVSDSAALRTAAAQLVAGDTLELAPGTYGLTSLRLDALRGRADAWITIRSRPGARAVLLGTAVENVVNVTDCAFLRFEDLDITSNGQAGGVDAVKFTTDTSSQDVTFDGCHLHHVSGNGVSSQAARLERLSLVRCEIDHCSNCGVYLGYPSPVRLAIDTAILDCYLHDIADPALSTGYGIQIKAGSYGSRIEGNVLHHVGGFDRAGIAVYYPDSAGGQPRARWNVIRDNLLWAVPNEGIWVVNSAIVENNVVVDADVGIAVSSYGGGRVVDLGIVHNTVYRCPTACVSLGGWSNDGSACVLANNALLQDNAASRAILANNGLGSATLAGNAIHGTASSVTRGIVTVTAPALTLRGAGPLVAIEALDLRPAIGSSMLGAADATFRIARDVDGHARAVTPVTGGAYADQGAATWPLQPWFKPTNAALAPRVGELRPTGSVAWQIHTDAPGGSPYALVISGGIDESSGWLPVRLDALSALTFAGGPVLSGYFGALDTDGSATPRFVLPAITLTSALTLYHAAVWLDAGVMRASEVARLVIVP